MNSKFSRFMYGRCGYDNLSLTLLITALVLSLLLELFNLPGGLLLLAAIAYCGFRAFSRNTAARRRENDAFSRLTAPVAKWWQLCRNKWRDRKTARYIRCPGCKNTLRLPRGRGEITVTCPVCGRKFDFRS